MNSKANDDNTETGENITNSLPPKKRFKYSVRDEQKIEVEEDQAAKGGKLVAGVIRHTSCPDHAVSYVYLEQQGNSHERTETNGASI